MSEVAKVAVTDMGEIMGGMTLEPQDADAETADGEGQQEPWNDTLHDLNNLFLTILLNSQLVAWRLPSYSRLRRNLHEMERTAQRGGLLVARLRTRLGCETDGKARPPGCDGGAGSGARPVEQDGGARSIAPAGG